MSTVLFLPSSPACIATKDIKPKQKKKKKKKKSNTHLCIFNALFITSKVQTPFVTEDTHHCRIHIYHLHQSEGRVTPRLPSKIKLRVPCI